MKRTVKLPERLAAIARHIDWDSRVADIGTDHGYLPIYLALTDTVSKQAVPKRRIIASDVSRGSLESARRNAARYNVTDSIEFVLAQGLDRIGQRDVDVIVIAGVGGETILGILSKAPWTADACASEKLKLILQPQTKLEVLKNFLYDSGYKISEELTVADRGRAYIILVVSG